MADAHDHDSVWKENLDRFLQPFLELTFTKVDRSIDGSVAPISLEQELRKTGPDADLGPLRADELMKMRLLNGTDEWLIPSCIMAFSSASSAPPRESQPQSPAPVEASGQSPTRTADPVRCDISQTYSQRGLMRFRP
jgi:hypothetical protein